MKISKLSILFLLAFIVLSGCKGEKTEEEREKEQKEEEQRKKDMELLYDYATSHAGGLIAENCGAENQPECEEVCVNTEFLKKEKMKEACYIFCDFDPDSFFTLSLGELIGAVFGGAFGETLGKALTLGMVSDPCQRSKPADD